MRIDLNLARDPFRNRSLFWLAMGAAYLVAFTVLIAVVARAARVGGESEALRDQRAKQEKSIKDLEAQLGAIAEAQGQAVFSDTDRQALDDARELLNARSFSWSRLLNDLEPYVPAQAKLTSINITNLSGEGPDRVATLTIAGRGKDFGQMGLFIANLDRSGGRFRAEPVENGPDEMTQEFTFTIAVRYQPTAGVAAPAPAAGEGKGNV